MCVNCCPKSSNSINQLFFSTRFDDSSKILFEFVPKILEIRGFWRSMPPIDPSFIKLLSSLRTMFRIVVLHESTYVNLKLEIFQGGKARESL